VAQKGKFQRLLARRKHVGATRIYDQTIFDHHIAGRAQLALLANAHAYCAHLTASRH